MVLLQFQDNQGYATQIVKSELLSVAPDEKLPVIVDFEDGVDTRLLDVLVWTNLGNPQPIASFRYIGESSNATFFKIPISGERSVLLSHILSGCEDVERDCDYDASATLPCISSAQLMKNLGCHQKIGYAVNRDWSTIHKEKGSKTD